MERMCSLLFYIPVLFCYSTYVSAEVFHPQETMMPTNAKDVAVEPKQNYQPKNCYRQRPSRYMLKLLPVGSSLPGLFGSITLNLCKYRYDNSWDNGEGYVSSTLGGNLEPSIENIQDLGTLGEFSGNNMEGSDNGYDIDFSEYFGNHNDKRMIGTLSDDKPPTDLQTRTNLLKPAVEDNTFNLKLENRPNSDVEENKVKNYPDNILKSKEQILISKSEVEEMLEKSTIKKSNVYQDSVMKNKAINLKNIYFQNMYGLLKALHDKRPSRTKINEQEIITSHTTKFNTNRIETDKEYVYEENEHPNMSELRRPSVEQDQFGNIFSILPNQFQQPSLPNSHRRVSRQIRFGFPLVPASFPYSYASSNLYGSQALAHTGPYTGNGVVPPIGGEEIIGSSEETEVEGVIVG